MLSLGSVENDCRLMTCRVRSGKEGRKTVVPSLPADFLIPPPYSFADLIKVRVL